MNFSGICLRGILAVLGGLILVAAPMMVVAAAADSDDIAAYQTYTQRGYPPSGPYAAPSMNFAERNELQARLNYAEAQYERARQAGDRGAAKHWRKQVKHLGREFYGERHAEGRNFCAPYVPSDIMPPGGAHYGPPQTFYGPPAQPYALPGYIQEPYPPTGYPAAGYPPAGYPTGNPAAAYPTAGYPVAAPGTSGSMGGLGSLLGPLLGGGPAPSASPYAGYPQSPSGAGGSPYGASGGIGALLGPLLGAAPVR